MAGRHNFKELRKKMSPKRRRKNEIAIDRELRAMLLSELRRVAGITQTNLAKSMGIRQPTLSQLESQEDMQISTLRRIVKALGGDLEIIANLPTEKITLSQFR